MKLLCISLLSLLLGINAYSQPIFNNNNNKNKIIDIRLTTNIKNASMRYDNNTNEIVEDSLLYIYTDTTTEATNEYNLSYTTDLSQQEYNLHIGYIGLENFYVYAKIPLTYTSVIEKFTYNELSSQRLIKNDKSELYVEGINFDAGYTFQLGKTINIDLLGGLFIPFGDWKAPLYIDSSALFNNKWLNLNRKYELNLGTALDLNIKPIKLQIGCIYNHRGNDYADNIMTSCLVGLNSVENTEIYAKFKLNTPLSDYKDEYSISFWEYPYWQQEFSLELGYKMFFTSEFYVDVGYNLSLWGKNTLAKRTVNISIGYLF